MKSKGRKKSLIMEAARNGIKPNSVVVIGETHARLKSLSRDIGISIIDLVDKAVNKLVDEYER